MATITCMYLVSQLQKDKSKAKPSPKKCNPKNNINAKSAEKWIVLGSDCKILVMILYNIFIMNQAVFFIELSPIISFKNLPV